MSIGQSDVEGGFLAGAAGLLLFLCCAALFIEASKAYRRRFKYFTRTYNIYQVILFSLTITFVAPGFANNCWCAHNWQWQIGALVLCLGWFNLIIRLKEFPYTAIPINMFINICVTFLKVLFLPVLLLVAFALPFYMLFVHKATISEVKKTTCLDVNQDIWSISIFNLSHAGNTCASTGFVCLSCSCFS